MDEGYEVEQPVEPAAVPVDDLGIGPPPEQAAYEDYDVYISDKIAYATKKVKAEMDQA